MIIQIVKENANELIFIAEGTSLNIIDGALIISNGKHEEVRYVETMGRKSSKDDLTAEIIYNLNNAPKFREVSNGNQ